jgi:GAF domain-containing protein
MPAAFDIPDDPDRYAALMRHRLRRNIIGDAKSLELVEEAAKGFGVPMASIGIVGRTLVHLVAELGPTQHVRPRETSLIALSIASDTPLVVEDAANDPRFRDHPTVVRVRIGFFAAAPLIDRIGYRLGGFIILDAKPRAMPAADIALLRKFAARAMQRVELLSTIAELARSALTADTREQSARDVVEW